MNFFSKFIENVKAKKAELDDRREFTAMVDEQAKPIRRTAYMQQMLKEAITEGKEKAKIDAQKRIPKQPKKPSDFGIGKEQKNEADPWAFLDDLPAAKNSTTKQKSNQNG